MTCDENCLCLVCLQLSGCEKNLLKNDNKDNFILAKSDNSNKNDNIINSDCEPKVFTYFGMEIDFANNNFEKFSTIGKPTEIPDDLLENLSQECKTCEINENKHKSVIYVNTDDNNTKMIDANSNIVISEKIDEHMSLDTVENSHFINVVFKQTFSLASQIINEIHMCGNEYYSDESDDFPLGMEADLLRQYMEDKRY